MYTLTVHRFFVYVRYYCSVARPCSITRSYTLTPTHVLARAYCRAPSCALVHSCSRCRTCLFLLSCSCLFSCSFALCYSFSASCSFSPDLTPALFQPSLLPHHHPNFSTKTSTFHPSSTNLAAAFLTSRTSPSGPETTTQIFSAHACSLPSSIHRRRSSATSGRPPM
jgi:hypothetical protein